MLKSVIRLSLGSKLLLLVNLLQVIKNGLLILRDNS